MAHGRSVNKGNHCCILEFISLLAIVDRLVAKTSVAICRIAVNLSIRASSGGKRHRIQHGAARDRKVNKDNRPRLFTTRRGGE